MGKLLIISCSDESFENRIEAGQLLGKQLKSEYFNKEVVVLGIPRGGIVVANEISRVLNAELDVVLSRKLGAPGNPELAIGAISESGILFLNKELAVSVGADEDYIKDEKMRQLSEITRRIELYRKIRNKVPLKQRLVIITDDGIATGATMQASLWAAHQEEPKKLIAALPVGAKESLQNLKNYADEVIVLRVPAFLGAISQFYLNFGQTTDEEVVKILKEPSQVNINQIPGGGNDSKS